MNGTIVRATGWLLLAAGLCVTGVGLWRRQDDAGFAAPISRGPRSVVLVTLDTTRADHLGPYGYRDISTPTLDRVASEGILFDRAYSVAPITLVAHTTMLTGLYPPHHGVRNNGLHYVLPTVETLAERLRGSGYRTAAFVSAAVLERRYGLDQGFEIYDDDLSAGRERHPRMVPDRPAEAVVAAARAWLGSLPAGERFFLWVHFYDPHAAYSPPPPYRDQYRNRLYDGEIAYLDVELGKLLAHELISRDTVVVVVGDHGESFGEHGEQTHAILTYDATLRIPWIMQIPDGPRGMRLDTPGDHADLVPTLLDLLGLPAVDGVAGRSMMPAIEGQPTVAPRDLYAETYLPYYTYGWAKLRVLRRDRWKLIDGPSPELYDIRRDPKELTNLFEASGAVAHDMRRSLEEFLARSGDAERETTLTLDTEQAERLRSLGYLAMGPRVSTPAADRPDPKKVISLHVDLEMARLLLRDRLYEQAIQRLDAVLRRDPENLAALFDLALAHQGSGHLAEAISAGETALKLDPGSPRAYLLLSELENRSGRSERALALVDSALKLDPRFVESHIRKALLLFELNRSREARTVLESALGLAPEDPRLNTIYAEYAEVASGKMPAAERRLRRALVRDPFLVLGWRVLGELLERSGRHPEAEEAYRKGLERQPDDADLHARLGLLLARQGGEGQTEMHLREAIRLGEEFRSDLHVALGAWLGEHGRFDVAQAEYERVLAVEPRHPGARNNRAIAYYHSGRAAEAEVEWKRLIAEFPRHPDAHANLAALALDRKQWSLAEGHARRTLTLDPKNVEAWSNLGIAQDGQKNYVSAKESFRKALALDSRYWPARNNLATTLRKEGRWQEAAVLFEEVLQQVPMQPEVHLELGRLYAGPLKNPERARSHLNAFLRAAERHPEAAIVRRQIAGLPPSAPAR